MDEKERQKITILLAEYNTLRAEVMAARSAFHQAIRIGITVLIALVGFALSKGIASHYWVIWLIASAVALLLLSLVYWNDVNTFKFTARLRELEAEINRRAGERLLIWESEMGWDGMIRKRSAGKPDDIRGSLA